ncbi:MAG: response regulator [Chitinivibrionales bacterium]|nr:response regulator [Chitinivibrionales bacterium]
MIRKNPRLLIVEDDESAQFGYQRYLSKVGYEPQAVSTLKEARDIVAQKTFDAILLDLKLPDGNALQWIPQIKNTYPGVPVLVLTGLGDIPTAVQATKSGADYFLTKPIDMDELKANITKSLEYHALRRKNLVNQRLKRKNEPFFGNSDAVSKLLRYAEVAAANETVILIQGETGSGKGVLARWIHDYGQRESEAFVELNCSSLKGELLRSELFGHVKGSFTSAIKDREGLVEVADGGTLFLDEIGDMDMEVQAQLLKTIEERSFRRIGENKLRTSDFRLICASNRNLRQKIEEGEFRKDLYYRICVFPISVPSLSERKEDIPGLSEHLLAEFGYSHLPLAPDVIELLKRYSWPGNVRELRNMLERAMLLASGENIATSHFPGMDANVPVVESNNENLSLDDIVKHHVVKVLQSCNGDKNQACKILGISLSSLYRRLGKIN